MGRARDVGSVVSMKLTSAVVEHLTEKSSVTSVDGGESPLSHSGTRIKVTAPEACTVFRVKVRPGDRVRKGSLLCLYKGGESNASELRKVRSNVDGIVKLILVSAGEQISFSAPLFEIEHEKCAHSIVVKMICAECGQDLKAEFLQSQLKESSIYAVSRDAQRASQKASQTFTTASVSMIHNAPELMVSSDIATDVATNHVQELLRKRKLVLIVDLDQTLIHTTNEDVPPNLKDVHHFQLCNRGAWYHTKLRPDAIQMLQQLSSKFELHVITFGVRLYAHMIASVLDPDGKFFQDRIMSRDEIECFGNDKTANFSSLFPVGHEMVCVIDDRDDIWRYLENVIKVPAYKFFPSIGDINEPLLSRPPKQNSNQTTNDQAETTDIGATICENLESKFLLDKDIPNGALNTQQKNQTLNNDLENLQDSKVVSDKNLIDEPANEDSGATQTKGANDENCKKEESSAEVPTSGKKRKRKSVFGDLKVCLECEENVPHECKLDGCSIDEGSKISAKRRSSNGNKVDGGKEVMEWEDADDFLPFLKDILLRVHEQFYEQYDRNKSKTASEEKGWKSLIPNVKDVINEVKGQTLRGCVLVFSAVVPTNFPLASSREYIEALSLGAQVSDTLNLDTCTHIIAARTGTQKVHQAKKRNSIHIVSPDWLWSCSQRWARVRESDYPLHKYDPSRSLKASWYPNPRHIPPVVSPELKPDVVIEVPVEDTCDQNGNSPSRSASEEESSTEEEKDDDEFNNLGIQTEIDFIEAALLTRSTPSQ